MREEATQLVGKDASGGEIGGQISFGEPGDF